MLIPAVENFLGFVTLTCFILGTVGNLLATIYFVQERRRNKRNDKKMYFTELYLFMAIVDFVLTVTLVPLFENYFTNTRSGRLFNWQGFCLVWGYLWELAPCISVFLVGVLSFSRMLILVDPMVQLRVNYLRFLILAYLALQFLIKLCLWFNDTDPLQADKIQYTNTTGYCYFSPQDTILWQINAFVTIFSLGAPVIPIFLSFTASLIKLRESAKASASQNFNRAAQTQATITIIIVTCVYLVCNIPIFINYLWYSVVLIRDDEDFTMYYDVYSGPFFGWLVWNIAYCVLVALNSAVNPMVFLLRMKPFQNFIWGLLRKQQDHVPAWPAKSVMGGHHHHGGNTGQGSAVKENITTSSF
eukprot:sb/3466066/